MLFKNWCIILCIIKFSNGYDYKDYFDKISLPDNFTNSVQNAIAGNTISVRCGLDVLRYAAALYSRKPWALLMYDATVRHLPSGILNGNLVDLGEFDQCLNIENVVSKSRTIFGKYCLAWIPILSFIGKNQIPGTRMMSPNANVSAALGTCLPNSCSAKEIQKVYPKIIGMPLEFFDSTCQSKLTHPKLTGGDIAAISFLSVILCIMIVSTVYDAFLFYTNKKPQHSMLIAFSVLTNVKKLVATTKSSSQISCLHGIRVISMIWVMLTHRYSFQMSIPKRNLLENGRWLLDKKNMFVLGGSVSVDTFFILSGILVSYIFMAAMAKGFKFNIFTYYIHRYLRLTPVLAVILVIHLTLMKHLGSGPLWYRITGATRTCEEYWWSTLLYIQNYVNPQSMCISHSWYLNVDTQLFLLSPIILIPLKKWPKVGFSIAGVLLFGSILASFLTAWFFKLSGLFAANGDNGYQKYYYFATHTRAGPWLMGLLLGYYIYEIKRTNRRMSVNKFINLILWAVSLTILCACVFTGNETLRFWSYEYDRIANSFYVALLRPGWALGVCWVIFACVIGYGGPVNWFLSLPVFEVVSKFTYTMYLIHFPLQMIVANQARASITFNNFNTLYTLCGDIALTMAIALIFTLAFESPIIVIEKVIFGTEKKNVTPQTKPIEDVGKSDVP